MHITTSLAGRTAHPAPVAGHLRVGGFGGPAGLVAYLSEHRVDRLIDATHPFATRISASARLACERTEVPRLMLLRPPWRHHPLDRWIEVDSIDAAAEVVGRLGGCALLTIGTREIAAFTKVAGVRFVVRVVEPPREPLPLPSCEVIVGRGPFTIDEEAKLIARCAIDLIVCKASGGYATEAKLIVARDRGIPVIMVRRPRVEPGEAVESVEAALDWLAGARPYPKRWGYHER